MPPPFCSRLTNRSLAHRRFRQSERAHSQNFLPLGLPDARAENVLADPGFDAPEGKPCAMTRVNTLGEREMEEHRYRYDADGRLRFIDIYDEGTAFTKRVAFVWAPSSSSLFPKKLTR
jgi:YD repeat-containing protein